jgi:hypothetical protein
VTGEGAGVEAGSLSIGLDDIRHRSIGQPFGGHRAGFVDPRKVGPVSIPAVSSHSAIARCCRLVQSFCRNARRQRRILAVFEKPQRLAGFRSKLADPLTLTNCFFPKWFQPLLDL